MQALISLHRFRRQTHVTPKSYLSFVDGYKTIYAEKRSPIGALANRMNTGLDKLVEASASVAELAKELVVKEKELAVASVKADKVSLVIFEAFTLHSVPNLEDLGITGKLCSLVLGIIWVYCELISICIHYPSGPPAGWVYIHACCFG